MESKTHKKYRWGFTGPHHKQAWIRFIQLYIFNKLRRNVLVTTTIVMTKDNFHGNLIVTFEFQLNVNSTYLNVWCIESYQWNTSVMFFVSTQRISAARAEPIKGTARAQLRMLLWKTVTASAPHVTRCPGVACRWEWGKRNQLANSSLISASFFSALLFILRPGESMADILQNTTLPCRWCNSGTFDYHWIIIH